MVWSLRFIQVTVFVYLISTIVFRIPSLPEPAVISASLIFLVFWLGFPYALHKDRQYVSEKYGWDSSKWHYLGFLPSIVGIIFIVNYLYKRDKNIE